MRKLLILVGLLLSTHVNAEINSFHIANANVNQNKVVVYNSLNELNIPLVNKSGIITQVNVFNIGDKCWFGVGRVGWKFNVMDFNLSPMIGYDNYKNIVGIFEVTKYISY